EYGHETRRRTHGRVRPGRLRRDGGQGSPDLRHSAATVSIRTTPLEGDELAGFAGAVPFETKRIGAMDRRATPGGNATGTGFRARQVVDLRHLAVAGRSHQRFGRSHDVLGRNLGRPFRKIRRDLYQDGCDGETPGLSLHHVAEAFWPAARLAAEDGQQGGALRV